MYYGGWFSLVTISLLASIGAFVWALRSGQFSDQERARFLALDSDLLARPAPAAPGRRYSAQRAALGAVLVTGIVALAAALVMSICLR
jgi:cbb3-type cytochrome oxidase maturation protein